MDALRTGGVGILPTDTIYGIVGSALRADAVQKIYAIRRRNPKSPLIVLIGDIRDMEQFGARADRRTKKLLNMVWPGKVSVILPVNARGAAKFRYLHRGTRTLAFRLPAPKWLRAFLRKTGPLVAPSANLSGIPPARTIAAAKKYFGGRVAFYADAGRLASHPSTLVTISKGKFAVLRKGAARIPGA